MLSYLSRHVPSLERDPLSLLEADAGAGGGRFDTPERRSRCGRSTVEGLLRRLIARLDAGLSRRDGVRTFATDSRCLLRFASAPAPCSLRLPDGTGITAGEPIVDLHLWNEHVPPVPNSGPNLAWGRTVYERLDFSMWELARAVRTDPTLRGVQACRARTNFAGPGCQTEAITRLTERCGFGDVDEGVLSFGARVHDGFENLLIAALVWTHNPEALCRRKLRRVRRPVWISRERLLALYPER